MTRGAGTILLALVTGALLAGCTPEPSTPTPTPTFTSDDDAFAAAEATYRAYVDALNQVDLSDPATFEPVYAWTTGELNASDRQGLSSYHADGTSVTGSSRVNLVEPVHQSPIDNPRVAVCLDVSSVEVVDSDGRSLVSEDRVDVQSLVVEFVVTSSSETGLLVQSIGPRSGAPSCN